MFAKELSIYLLVLTGTNGFILQSLVSRSLLSRRPGPACGPLFDLEEVLEVGLLWNQPSQKLEYVQTFSDEFKCHQDREEEETNTLVFPDAQSETQPRRRPKPVLVVFDNWSSCEAPSLKGRPNHHAQPIHAYFDRWDMLSTNHDHKKENIEDTDFPKSDYATTSDWQSNLILPMSDRWVNTPSDKKSDTNLIQSHDIGDTQEQDGVEVVAFPMVAFTKSRQPSTSYFTLFDNWESCKAPSMRNRLNHHHSRPIHTPLERWDSFSGNLEGPLEQSGSSLPDFPLRRQAKRAISVFDNWDSCKAPSMRGRPNHQSIHTYFDAWNGEANTKTAKIKEPRIVVPERHLLDPTKAQRTIKGPSFDHWLSDSTPSTKSRTLRRLSQVPLLNENNPKNQNVVLEEYKGVATSTSITGAGIYREKLEGKVFWEPKSATLNGLKRQMRGGENHRKNVTLYEGTVTQTNEANGSLQKDLCNGGREAEEHIFASSEALISIDDQQVETENEEDTVNALEENFLADIKSRYKMFSS